MGEHVSSIIDVGSSGTIVEIECHVSNNLPAIVIVGSASKAVDEAKERVRAAFTTSHLELPRKRVTINLAPADLPKTDSSFDLAIAAAILHTTKQTTSNIAIKSIIVGELGLDGNVRPVRGIIGKILSGRHFGYDTFVIPEANMSQAQLIPNVHLLPIRSLKQWYDYLTTGTGIAITKTGEGIWNGIAPDATEVPVLGDIVGQEQAKRALEIAAAGGHNILLSGPPGTGKSMLAKVLPALLPALNREETLEVTHLHSLSTMDYETPVARRPFRAPHHSASLVALIGGGHNLRPGEISLAHRGVLFLDEIPEFNRTSLEALRQPLEDHIVTVARAKDTVTYPANFILVATANPCPCGYYGSTKPCICLPHQINHYQQRVSGPILDRIDLHVAVKDIDHKNLLNNRSDLKQSDGYVLKRINQARSLQATRYGSAVKLNSDMTNSLIKTAAHISPDAKSTLDTAAERLAISARSYMKIIKVARTIADLDASSSIELPHITEALQYRRQDHLASI